MIGELFNLSNHFLTIYNREYQRYFARKNDLSNRFSIIIGHRGVGKTTVIIQHALSKYGSNLPTRKVLYIQADHFLIGGRSLYRIAEEFSLMGGELLCVDEIHKYPNWSGELKSIYDTFPDLKMIVSGSSLLEIAKGSHDLSRRAIIYKMHGLSFREFLELRYGFQFSEVSLKEILQNHESVAFEIIKELGKKSLKILPLFAEYLEYGYYPFFLNFNDKALYHTALEQNIRTTLESDLPAVHPELTGVSVRKITKLLSVMTGMVPFVPDMIKLKNLLEVGDERTLKTYFRYLENAGIINILYRDKDNFRQMAKPEKIYFNNTNLLYSMRRFGNIDQGNVRETFFLNSLRPVYEVTWSKYADFLVDDELTFEVGGRSKGFSQVKDVENSFVVSDGIETGSGNRIPLYLFSFLY
ncbi:MAG: ATP-binding protein [Ignavibacteriaceae bacterium]|nr:AAA family ATPase [Ignavibacteriaceae bacterium]NUM72661.1 ATP-binding protein [Ignavibacteriaceae bacterium]